MTNAATKAKFSGSTDGKPIDITQTATPGTLIHTAVLGTTLGTFDEIWLYLSNRSAADIVVTIEYGDALAASNIIYTVGAKDGLKHVLPGCILQNGATLKIFAAAVGISAHGWVNQIVHT